MALARRATDARLKYLRNASEALLTSSPATSTHLGAVHNSVSEGQEGGSSPTCAACGALMVVGWSCATTSERVKKRSRKDRLAKTSAGVKAVSIKCKTCGAVTVLESDKPGRPKRTKTTGTELSADSKDVASEVQAATLDGPNHESKPVKKRARGKKSSLQSLIASQKAAGASPRTGFGLEMKDFMKT